MGILTQIRSSFKNHPLNFLRKNNQFFSKAEKILLYKKENHKQRIESSIFSRNDVLLVYVLPLFRFFFPPSSHYIVSRKLKKKGIKKISIHSAKIPKQQQKKKLKKILRDTKK